MKIWITKYALTTGIEMIESERMASFSIDGALLTFCRYSWSTPEQYTQKYWHKDRASAIAHAEEMRKNKISSLQKQITKLESIKFE